MQSTCVCVLMILLLATPAFGQSRGVVVPIPDAVARGLGVLEAVTGQDLLAPLKTVTQARFGASGQWLVGGASSLLVAGEHHRLDDYRDNTLAVDIRLSLGGFVARNTLIGATGGFGTQLFAPHASPSAGHLGPIVGYNIRLHEHASVLPILAVTYDTWTRCGAPVARHHSVNLGLDFTFVMQLSEHVALSLAPFVKQSIYHGLQGAHDPAQDKATWDTAYGVKVGILGWL